MSLGRMIGREDPCFCRSGRKLKDCCAALSRAPFHAFVRVTNVKTHHFFVVEHATGEMLRDAEGAILVWTDRSVAMAMGETLWPNRTVGVVGMGDEKWALFQAEERHVVIAP